MVYRKEVQGSCSDVLEEVNTDGRMNADAPDSNCSRNRRVVQAGKRYVSSASAEFPAGLPVLQADEDVQVYESPGPLTWRNCAICDARRNGQYVLTSLNNEAAHRNEKHRAGRMREGICVAALRVIPRT